MPHHNTKARQRELEMEENAQARMVKLMYLLTVAVEQLERGADSDVIRWTIGEAQAVARRDVRVQRMSVYERMQS